MKSIWKRIVDMIWKPKQPKPRENIIVAPQVIEMEDKPKPYDPLLGPDEDKINRGED